MTKTIVTTKWQRDIISQALIKECETYINRGLNNLSKKEKGKYNATFTLLLQIDSDKEFLNIYKDWDYIEVEEYKPKK